MKTFPIYRNPKILINKFLEFYINFMGISCCKNTSKKYKPESIPVSKQPEALPNDPRHTETHIQSLFFNSQDLENVSGMNTSSNYKIPIIKEDIRSVYKFSKQIGFFIFFLKITLTRIWNVR